MSMLGYIIVGMIAFGGIMFAQKKAELWDLRHPNYYQKKEIVKEAETIKSSETTGSETTQTKEIIKFKRGWIKNE